MMGASKRWPDDRAFAARAHVLLKQDALVRHVLVDEPQSLAVDGDDEAGVHLSQRLEVGEAGGAGRKLDGLRGRSRPACAGLPRRSVSVAGGRNGMAAPESKWKRCASGCSGGAVKSNASAPDPAIAGAAAG